MNSDLLRLRGIVCSGKEVDVTQCRQLPESGLDWCELPKRLSVECGSKSS